MRWFAFLLMAFAVSACSSEVTEYPSNTNINYQVAAAPWRDDAGAYRIRPGEQPARTASARITLPAKMMVANNGIYMVDSPWSGSKKCSVAYKSGSILLAEKVAGEWLYVRDISSTGWIHKDNLFPVSR